MQRLLQINNLTKKYDSRTIAGVSNINLEINQPGLYAIQGQSGCGKSTLLKLITGEIKADKGEINTFKNKISSMQIYNKEMNSKKVLDLMLELSFESLKDLNEEKRINLCREALMLFEITNEMNKIFKDLSSGQQQRLLLAVAFASKPQILIMDEPFSMIDSLTKRQILMQLKQIITEQQIVVLWVTHDSQDVFQFADYLYLMDHSKIVEHNKPIEIYNKPKSLIAAQYFSYNNIFNAQIKNQKILLPWGNEIPNTSYKDGHAIFSLRPSEIMIADDTKENSLITTKLNSYFLGSHFILELKYKDQIFYVQSLQDNQQSNLTILLNLSKLNFVQEL